MGMELGGRASKLGDTYERLWAVRHALMVIDGRRQSLLWEPIGEDENGIDLWITANDGHRHGHQLKRQNRSKEYWSIADLREQGVGPSRTYVNKAFYSTRADNLSET